MLWQDVRYGLRMLTRNPGFTLVAVLALALGVGANTAIFSVVNAVLLRPLPYPDPDQLALVFARTPREPREFVSYPDFEDWRAQSRSFEKLSAYVPQSVNLTGRDEPARLLGGFASADFLPMLGVTAAQGRLFLPGEDQPGAERVAVVTHALWQNRLGADPRLIGSALTLNGQPFTVVGILPEGFQFTWGDAEVYLPLPHYPNFSLERQRTSAAAIGRLKPGVTLGQAQAEMETIAGRLAAQYPETNADRGVTLVRLHDYMVERLRPSLLVLLGAVGFVLLISCANVANLQLARATARGSELAVRAALGASRARLMRQLLTESLLLALAGGGAGLLLGAWGVDVLAKYSPVLLPEGTRVSLDQTVLVFTLLVASLTGLISGLAPALRFSRPDLQEALKEGGRGAGEAGRRSRLRGSLVVVQVALALVLLIGSSLFIQSFALLTRVDPGFKPTNLLTLEYRVPQNKYPEGRQQWEFHRQVVERIRSLPGVEAASAVMAIPHGGNFGSTTFVPLDRPEPPRGAEPRAQTNRADMYYFGAMGIPLLKGRVFGEQDGPETPRVAVINQTLAERFWPQADPVGKSLRFPEGGGAATIIGVVGDVKHDSLDRPSGAQIYLAYAQNPFIFASLVVRTASDPMSLAPAVRGAIWSVDKDQPVWKVRTMEFLLDRGVGSRRYLTYLLAGFSVLALVLAAVGIYGVLAYAVTQRRHEIGVRVALGARPGDIYRMVLGQGMALAVVGIGTGLAAALALTRLLSGMLYGVSASDPLSFAGIAILLAAVALLACYVPARRATKVDPMVALRQE